MWYIYFMLFKSKLKAYCAYITFYKQNAKSQLRDMLKPFMNNIYFSFNIITDYELRMKLTFAEKNINLIPRI